MGNEQKKAAQAIRFVGYQPHRIKWLECCSKGEE